MSFNLSRTQFLQMFAVMQSFRLINSYTAARVAPGVGWQNLNIETEQFTALIDLLFKTPLMPSLKSMPPESNAPILINPFSKGGYLPHSGPGFLVIPESSAMVIEDDVLCGAGCNARQGICWHQFQLRFTWEISRKRRIKL